MEPDPFEPIMKKPASVFSNMPILCPWITSQPYQSTVKIKNKLNELESRKNSKKPSQPAPAQINSVKQQQSNESDLPTPNSYGFPIQESSSHFFYFLRLMQLFPETHPATIHTVLTLTKNNFFHAIDKLLYAKKCRSSFGKKGMFRARTNVKNAGVINSYHQKKTQENNIILNKNLYQEPIVVDNETFNSLEQETIVLEGSPYELEPISKDKPSDLSTQVFEICVDENGQSKQFDMSKLNNPDVIEIVCFEKDFDNKIQGFQKKYVLENKIGECGQQIMVLGGGGEASNSQDQKGGEFFFQSLSANDQILEEKMDLEPDIDEDLIKINTRPQMSISGKIEACEFENIIE